LKGSVRWAESEVYGSAKPNKFEARNTKWFDLPFDRLTVLSKVEGLTSLSYVEGQIRNPKAQMTETKTDHSGCSTSQTTKNKKT